VNMSDTEEVRRLVEEMTPRVMTSTFLTQSEVSELTGRKVRSKQIEALRQMGIAFWVNPVGRAVVTRSAIEGRAALAKKAGPVKPIPNVYKK
jgi:hypothetical protein